MKSIKGWYKNMSIITNETYLRYFEEITKIPHGSGNEKQLSDYLCRFARERGLKLEQDKYYNVVIYKPASKGYESHKPVALQAHIDMVEESDNEYDFSKGLQIYTEDGFIKAKDTTLGADDGIGVAMILSVLDDKALEHPAIEAIFTTQEETTMEGAFNLKPEYIKARRLINLDGETEGLSTTTSSGGVDVFFSKELKKVNYEIKSYKLYITNLSGGHSGAEIHKEKGNAIKILSRILKQLGDINLCSINGGNKINAIPRDASAVFVSDKSLQELNQLISEIVIDINNELSHSDNPLEYFLKEEKTDYFYSDEDTQSIINLIYLMPTGLRHKAEHLDNLTTASENIGTVNIDNDIFSLGISIRGALESYVQDMKFELFTLADVLNFDVNADNWYPAWDYMDDSKLRDLMCKAYKEASGEEMKLEGVHAGLECGIFKNKFPDMDIVAIGPTIYDCHSPKEKIEIASIERTYNFLKILLSKL